MVVRALTSWMPCLVVVVALVRALDATAKKGKGKPAPEPDPAAVPFTVIDRGQVSGIDTAQNVTVRDQQAWEALWDQHAEGTPPAVDFDNEIVVSVFLGYRPSEGHRALIDRVEVVDEDGDEVEDYRVEFVEEIMDGPVSGVERTPFEIAVVPRTEGEVDYRGTVVLVDPEKSKGKGKKN